jgi:hypothetical protein
MTNILDWESLIFIAIYVIIFFWVRKHYRMPFAGYDHPDAVDRQPQRKLMWKVLIEEIKRILS